MKSPYTQSSVNNKKCSLTAGGKIRNSKQDHVTFFGKLSLHFTKNCLTNGVHFNLQADQIDEVDWVYSHAILYVMNLTKVKFF